MQFKKITTIQPVADHIASRLINHLAAGEKVLWLVPGGSSIRIAVLVSRMLVGVSLSNLTVMLTDERYVMVGHDDSNWHQLQQEVFTLPGATMIPVLEGEDMAMTTTAYAHHLSTKLHDNDYRLGFFGIGSDGHTAGILPHSPALLSNDYAASYDAGNYKRVTMTELAIKCLDEVVVYATGEAKWPVLDDLEKTNMSPQDQPAQLLKSVPKLIVFNDYKGENI